MAQGGINLNPGADPTLVQAAYAAAMANVPRDLSGTFEALATNYAKTMQIVGASWSEGLKSIGKLAGEAVNSFAEGQKYLIRMGGIKNEEGVKYLQEKYKEIRKGLRDTYFKGNPFSEENREKRMELQQEKEKFEGQLENITLGYSGLADSLATDTYSKNATGLDNWRAINALGAYHSSSGKTKDGDYVMPDHDEHGDTIFTLYDKNEEKVLDKFGNEITIKPSEMKGLLKTRDEEASTNSNTLFNNMQVNATNSKTGSDEEFKHYLPQFRNDQSKLVKNSNNLHFMIHEQVYLDNESLAQDLNNPEGSVMSATVVGQFGDVIKKMTKKNPNYVDAETTPDEPIMISAFTDVDGNNIIDATDFTTGEAGAINYQTFTHAVLDERSPYYDEDNSRLVYLDWTEINAKKAWDFGVSQRKAPPAIDGGYEFSKPEIYGAYRSKKDIDDMNEALKNRQSTVIGFNNEQYTYNPRTDKYDMVAEGKTYSYSADDVRIRQKIHGYKIGEDPKSQSEINKEKVAKVGTTIKPGEYEPFESEGGNLVSDQNLKIVGVNSDGSYQVQDENGEIFNMPKPKP